MMASTTALELTSTAFQQGATIPREHTADGQNISPALKWDASPAGTKSFALVCDDPAAPRGVFTHWVIFNLPAESRELSAGVPPEEMLPNGAAQGVNGFGKLGYGGPAPPRGAPHRYYFRLYALDRRLDLKAGATKDNLLAAMDGHVLVEGQLMGAYSR